MAQLTKKSDNNQYLYALEDSMKLAFMLNVLSSKEIVNQNAAAAVVAAAAADDDDYHLSRKSICSTVDIKFHKRIA